MSHPSWKSTTGMIVLGLIVSTMGAFFFLLLGKGFQKARTTMEWKPTPATVTASWVEESQFSEDAGPRYKPSLRYEYTYNSKAYTGTRIMPNDKKSRDKEKIETLLSAYPVDQKVTAFVNPAAPEEAVLDHDTRAPGYSMWFPALFIVGGLGISISALVRKLR